MAGYKVAAVRVVTEEAERIREGGEAEWSLRGSRSERPFVTQYSIDFAAGHRGIARPTVTEAGKDVREGPKAVGGEDAVRSE